MESTPLFILLLLSLSPHFSTTHPTPSPHPNLVHVSCLHASYPTICLRSLSSCAAAATTPTTLAQIAVKVSLRRLHKTSHFLTKLKKNGGGGGRRIKGAIKDCVEEIDDSVQEIKQALSALMNLRRGSENFGWEMNNVQTWVSAALSDEDTCLDGFDEISFRSDVRRKIGNVARVTSNALYLINLLDDDHNKPRPGSWEETKTLKF